MLILAACTQSKRKAGATVLMRQFSGTPSKDVPTAWVAAVRREPATTALRNLYKGAYWTAVQRLREATDGVVYVVSAGHGLRGDLEVVQPYDATFSSGSPDSVPGASTVVGQRRWWAALGGSEALRALDPSREGPLVVVLPDSYLRVVEPDLIALGQSHPGNVVVFATRASPAMREAFGAHLHPVAASMTRALTVNVGALVPAVAERIVANCSVTTAPLVTAELARLRDPSGAPFYPTRARQTEDEVRAWIACRLAAASPPASASVALRAFRSEGLAFEQKRFHRVFADVLANSPRTAP